MKTLLFVLLSITAFGQTQRPDIAKRVVNEINRARANYGIWRAEDFKIRQSESSKYAMDMYLQYKGSPIMEDGHYSDFGSRKFVGAITSTVGVSISENHFDNIIRSRVEESKEFLNPLAYRVSVSAVKDEESGYIYWVAITYR
jgi:hypothetical protein